MDFRSIASVGRGSEYGKRHNERFMRSDEQRGVMHITATSRSTWAVFIVPTLPPATHRRPHGINAGWRQRKTLRNSRNARAVAVGYTPGRGLPRRAAARGTTRPAWPRVARNANRDHITRSVKNSSPRRPGGDPV